jgi:hypothetical protein
MSWFHPTKEVSVDRQQYQADGAGGDTIVRERIQSAGFKVSHQEAHRKVGRDPSQENTQDGIAEN